MKVANLNPAILPYMSYWPEPNGGELLSGGLPSGTALSYNNPRQAIREDFGTLRADYNAGSRDYALPSPTPWTMATASSRKATRSLPPR